ncbi:uncharacterized protein LOC108624190 [Ceratina calcarata]|uniref:Uncharacterized protein LOC108624190 n=1 Tax=Ceratina calcarata TaxID=156304 RepID=A0AAJ7IXB0_9HYME|nr:uncharacterized protein LOC108624190 [Ceratina calcarata]
MERKQVLRLIELYRQQTLLWDPKYRDCRYKERKDEAWATIGRQMDMHPIDCQRKMENLKSSLRRETMKIRRSKGRGSEDVYESRWFGFEPLQFLLRKYKPYSQSDRRSEDDEAEVEPTIFVNVNDEENENSISSASLPAHPTAFEIHTFPDSEGGGTTLTPLPKCPPRKKIKLDCEKLNEPSDQIPHGSTRRTDDHNYHFGNLVASKLSHFSEEVQYALQADIMNLFLKAKQGYYDKNL